MTDNAHSTEERPLWPSVGRGFMRKCPNCGEGALFQSYLKTVDRCAICDERMDCHRADDGPAYLTIIVVGHLLAIGLHFVWQSFRPPAWMMATGFTIGCVLLSLYLLPRFKGAIVGFQWAKRMHGFDENKDD